VPAAGREAFLLQLASLYPGLADIHPIGLLLHGSHLSESPYLKMHGILCEPTFFQDAFCTEQKCGDVVVIAPGAVSCRCVCAVCCCCSWAVWPMISL
jgi:hypothetical protein